MDRIRVSAVCLNQTPLDFKANTDRIIKYIRESKEQGAQVICFPELTITGYNCEDMFLSLQTVRESLYALERILPETKEVVVALGLPLYFRGALYNCAVMVQNGSVLGVKPKTQLPREGVHYESRWFQAWPFGEIEQFEILGKTVPFGDLPYKFGGLQVAVEICEEAWGVRSQNYGQGIAGVELVLNLSASHFALGKYKTREVLVKDASRKMQVHYVYTNLLGCESGRLIYDGGAMIASNGVIVARSKRFSYADGYCLVHDIDLDDSRAGKLENRNIHQKVESSVISSVVEGEKLPSLEKSVKITSPRYKKRDEVSSNFSWEFMQAVSLGLFDYMRKSRSFGYTLSLSGGCDSSAVAVLVAQSISMAIEEIGAKEFAKNIHLEWKSEYESFASKDWVGLLLTTVYQATKNSGEITFNAAKELAAELGAKFHAVDIDKQVESYLSSAEAMIGRKLDWKTDDITLQNIQSRSRAPMVWILANINGSLLLSTSNRSEVALGYATMDGDTAGGLSPIGGIDKYFLRKWLVWMERENTYGIGKISSLKLVNDQDPTAELRPKEYAQKDEQDLMPYEIINYIEKCFLEKRMSPEDIKLVMAENYCKLSNELISTYVDRFFNLWQRNQWKRERYAPSFLVDDISLDPKTWCRYPILSGSLLK